MQRTGSVFEVKGFICELPKNCFPSAEKRAQAAALGIILGEHQTIVDLPYNCHCVSNLYVVRFNVQIIAGVLTSGWSRSTSLHKTVHRADFKLNLTPGVVNALDVFQSYACRCCDYHSLFFRIFDSLSEQLVLCRFRIFNRIPPCQGV